MTPARGLRPDDLGSLATAADPRVAPDGSTVAFVVTRPDLVANRTTSQVWAGPTDGSAPARPVTAGGERRDATPRWAPDGASLAFVARLDGAAAQVLVLPWNRPGEVRVAATAPATEGVEALEWSPDGRWLAYVARIPEPGIGDAARDADRRPRRLRALGWRMEGAGWLDGRRAALFVVPADGTGPARTLVALPGVDVGAPAWSPDGTRLAFAAAAHHGADLDRLADLFVVPLAGGPPHRVTDETATCASPVWSPDGSALAHVRYQGAELPNLATVAVLDVATGAVTTLGDDLDRHLAAATVPRPPAWHDGRWLWSVEDDGEVVVVGAPAGGGPSEVVLGGGRRVVTGFDVAGGCLAAVVATWATPGDVVAVELSGGVEHVVADFGAPLRAVALLPEGERFDVPTTDGTEHVTAWLVRPEGIDTSQPASCPVLLSVHGGPFGQYTDACFDEFAIEAAAGFAVVACNPRGSSGRGAAWGRAVRWPSQPEHPGGGWGGVDAQDVLAVLDAALARWPWLDGRRVALLGGSYGGFMASWLAARAPGRWSAVVSERAVNNLLTMAHTSDIGWWFNVGYSGAGPEHPEVLLERSPVTYADAITAPMLLVHSEDDRRCPVEQAEDLFTRLRRRGHDVELVRFPGEGHELSRSGSPWHRRWRFELILDFLRIHLAPDAPPEPEGLA